MDRTWPLRWFRPTILGLLCAALLLGASGTRLTAGKNPSKKALTFAAEMARKGNWREALFRWEKIAADTTDNPRLWNNLAVASEALGLLDDAAGYYEKSLALQALDQRVIENHSRFLRFRELVGRNDEPTDDEGEVYLAQPDAKGTKKGKSYRVPIDLPVPPAMSLEGMESILVASFIAPDTSLLNVNRELVKFLRGEFRQHTELDVLDVVPPPAIPEQSLEDLLANAEFWKYLSREYEADLIVSGIVDYDRTDASTFQDVDVISPRTGQKVRQGMFVEQEEFFYELHVFFVDGKSGEILHRERFRRSMLFRGTSNDPIAAFYELSESIAIDVMGAVSTRLQRDSRIIFKG